MLINPSITRCYVIIFLLRGFCVADLEDPEQLLPSWDLLDLQWKLQRVVAMSGAAGWPSLNFDEDDDYSSDSMLIINDSSESLRSAFPSIPRAPGIRMWMALP